MAGLSSPDVPRILINGTVRGEEAAACCGHDGHACPLGAVLICLIHALLHTSTQHTQIMFGCTKASPHLLCIACAAQILPRLTGCLNLTEAYVLHPWQSWTCFTQDEDPRCPCSMREVMCAMHLGLNVGGEVIGEQVVVAARCDGVHHWLKEVRPAKCALPHKIHHMLKALVRLHSTCSSVHHSVHHSCKGCKTHALCCLRAAHDSV